MCKVHICCNELLAADFIVQFTKRFTHLVDQIPP